MTVQRRFSSRRVLAPVTIVVLVCFFVCIELAPIIGAHAFLRPARRPIPAKLLNTIPEVTLQGFGVELKGWYFPASQKKRGTLIYLHGVTNNRSGVVGIADRFTPKGFDVIAYDSRAHGRSGGENCTYGFYEKEDLRKVLNTVTASPIFLLGNSMGAAIALQTASIDRRIKAVIAAEVFSDLNSIVRERVPDFLPEGMIGKFRKFAEKQANFSFDAVSPENAASHISVPVLLIHGAMDWETAPENSRRVYNALQGKKKLLLVPDAGHNQSLQGTVWQDIEKWIETVL